MINFWQSFFTMSERKNFAPRVCGHRLDNLISGHYSDFLVVIGISLPCPCRRDFPDLSILEKWKGGTHLALDNDPIRILKKVIHDFSFE
ncbi:MAG: hypothetical protein ACREX0_14985 [Noviherbaspirillum sp.]